MMNHEGPDPLALGTTTNNLDQEAAAVAAAFGTPLPTTDNHVSILVSEDGGICELVATEMTTGLTVNTIANNNNNPEAPQGGGAEVRFGMSGPTTELTSYEHVVRMPMITVSPVHLARALWTVALLTVSIDIITALYKPASGVVFAHSSLAYYLTLTTIFVLGVAEAFTAFWVSSSRDADVRRLTFGRVVLCASVGPFVAIVGIGGFAFIEG